MRGRSKEGQRQDRPVLQARLHAHGLIAKSPRTRRWRVTNYGRNVMGTSLYLREHHFPNVYSGVAH